MADQPAEGAPPSAARGEAGQLSHLDERGQARMVDVGAKEVTHRCAVAAGFVSMAPETVRLISEGAAAKGDVLAAARIAGIQAAKHASDLIPLCHPLSLTHASVDFEIQADGYAGVGITATVETDGKTGVEMEALAAVSIAALTIYDMCKAADRGMLVTDVRLVRKEGGRSGTWTREEG